MKKKKEKRVVTRGTQATTLQLTPATEGRNPRGRGPTVQTPSFEKLVHDAAHHSVEAEVSVSEVSMDAVVTSLTDVQQ
jgi:hypothetical protein